MQETVEPVTGLTVAPAPGCVPRLLRADGDGFAAHHLHGAA